MSTSSSPAPWLLRLCGHIDRLSALAAQTGAWAMLLSTLISAGNALARYSWTAGSNAWLEIQWYFFAACVMLGAAHVLQANEHVRVDLVYGRLKPRAQVWIDLLGLTFFLLPVTLFLAWISWPFFLQAWHSGEGSENAGGLVRWPVLLMLPVGFSLLSLQGLCELVKRAAWLTGARHATLSLDYERPLQ